MANGPSTIGVNGSRLTLTAFGSARLSSIDGAGRETTLLDGGKPLALIVYLACAPKRHAPRDSVIDLLWADLEPNAARHALRQTLWHTKRRVADGLLTTAGDSLTLSDRISADRDVFLAAASADDVERVVQLYAGDFFPTFAAPGGAEFEKWADTERRYLRSVYQRSCDVLVRQYLSQARFREAHEAARRRRNLDRENEAAWRLVLESLIAGRELAAAKLEADALEQVLASEERTPEQSTRSLIRLARQSVSAEASAGHSTTGFVAELIGREREFSAIMRAWDRVRLGEFQHVCITAPAGMGKTRLLADVGARLRAMPARIVHVRAIQPSREIPYALASDIAGELSGLPGAAGVSPDCAATLVALTPLVSSAFSVKPDRATGDEALRRRTIALRDLLAAVSDHHPLVILLDDLHWADTQSYRILASAVGGATRQRILIVTASRRAPSDAFESTISTRLELAPLTEPEVLAFVSSLGAMPAAPWATCFIRSLTEATRGSPLLILETLHLLLERGLLVLRESEWHVVQESELREALRAESALAVRIAALSEAERMCLCVLAVAGVPVRRESLAAMVPGVAADLWAILQGLEARGVVARHGDAWEIVHDEIARAVVNVSSSDALVDAEGALGEQLWHDAGNDLGRIRRAALHLARGQREVLLTLALIRFATLLREGGDRRRHTQIAAELVRVDADSLRARELTRVLPVHMRLGLYTRRRRAVFGGAVLSLALFAVNRLGGEPGPPDVELMVLQPSGSTAEIFATPTRIADWTVGAPLEVRRHRAMALRVATDMIHRPMVPRPGERGWAQARAVQDGGVLDVYITGSQGRADRRMTFSNGDDLPMSWSPDGKYVAVMTGQWSQTGQYDIAVLNDSTGTMQQITSGDASDLEPMWSPDGTRIGFTRSLESASTDSACSVRVDGSDQRCVAFFDHGSLATVGWLDQHHMLLRHWARETGHLLTIHWQSGQVDTLVKGVLGGTIASTDGQWIACYCRTQAATSGAWIAFPSAAPDRVRRLVAAGVPLAKNTQVFWYSRTTRYLDTLRVVQAPNDAQIGVPHRLSLVGRTKHGDPVAIHSVTWTVSDTMSATIEPTNGVLLPRRPGYVTAVASTGGWRSAAAPVTIRSRSKSVILFREDWNEPVPRKWFVFGDPTPSIVTETWGKALATNGDANFTSGAHTQVALQTRDGLALDALVSVPVTLPRWQNINVGFVAGLDTLLATPLLRANGEHERWSRRPETQCVLSYPGGGEGATSVRWIAAYAGIGASRVPARSLFTGRPVRVRVQLFPDGRCGLAVEGEPVFVSTDPVIRGDSVHVITWGMSVETRVTLGPVTVRSGVPGDVDWSRTAIASREIP